MPPPNSGGWSERPVRRTRLGAWWDARFAVRSGVPRSEYLNFRLGQYSECRPLNRHPLPFNISVNGKGIVVEPNPKADQHPLRLIMDDPETVEDDGDGPDAVLTRWVGARSETEEVVMRRELRETEEEGARLDARLIELNERRDEATEKLQQDIAAGRIPSFEKATPDSRPEVPCIWHLIGFIAAIAAFVILEGWQLALLYMNLTGIDISNLDAEWRRNPVGILMASGFALSACAGLFLLFHWLWEIGLSAYTQSTSKSKTMMKAGMGAALALLLLATTCGIGSLRHDLGSASTRFSSVLNAQNAGGGSSKTNGSLDNMMFILLTITVSLGVAYMWHQAQEILENEDRQWKRRLFGTQNITRRLIFESVRQNPCVLFWQRWIVWNAGVRKCGGKFGHWRSVHGGQSKPSVRKWNQNVASLALMSAA